MKRMALICPGQGSQRVGMGVALAEAHPEAARVYEEVADTLGISTNTVYSRLRAARQNVERQAQRLANLEKWRAL